MRRLTIALGILASLLWSSSPQPQLDKGPGPGPRNADELMAVVDPLIQSAIADERVPGAVFVFVQDGQVLASRGYGLADVERKVTVDPERTLFRVGSISKVFTATALMQLVDRGNVLLDRDVNAYLKGLSVPATYPQAVTGHHLLSHTAGFDEITAGRRATTESGVLPLDRFLSGRLIRIAPPGEIPSYSTYGITLAGLLVEQVSGMPFERYLREHIWRPLGMQRTANTLTPELRADLAIGYELQNGTAVAQPYEWHHTTPASSINATALDMARFMLAFLSPKSGSSGLLSARATETMLASHARGHPAVPGVAYGFFEGDYAGQRIREHDGMMAGVSASMVLLPEHHAGFFMANHFEQSTLRDRVRAAILDRFYTRSGSNPVPGVFPGSVERFAGRYRWNVYCRSCGSPAPTQGPTVEAQPDGSITFAGKRWIQTDPLAFKRDDGKQVLGFRADSDGNITHLFIDGALTFERIR